MKPCAENVSDSLPINKGVSAVQLGRKPFAETTWFLHPLYGVDDIRFESWLLQKYPVLFAAAFTERLATVDGEREGATRVRQGESRLFHLNAACLVGFAIPE